MDKATFNCKISSSDFSVPLGMEIWVDDQMIFDQEHVTQDHRVEYDLNDDGEHELRFVLKNKLPEHTKIDQDGNIVSDATLLVSNIRFEDTSCQQIVYDLAKYLHNFNGNGDLTTQKFYGEMGCNGTVTLKFTTPIYLWLLENM